MLLSRHDSTVVVLTIGLVQTSPGIAPVFFRGLKLKSFIRESNTSTTITGVSFVVSFSGFQP